MIKITLDTNCIINLLDFKASTPTSVDALSEIIRYAMEGDVNIAITTRVEKDFDGDKNEDRKKEMVRKIRMFPVIGTIVRLDISKLDSGDFLAGENDEKLENELKALLFSTLDKEDTRYLNKINDIDHLIGHIKNKRDIFVTDDKDILRRVDKLKDSFNIVVMNPSQCLEYLDLRAKKEVLVQQVLDKIKFIRGLISKTIEEGYVSSMEKEYAESREWLLKKFSKIQDGLLTFRYRTRSVPVGSQRLFDQDSIINLQQIPGIFEELYEERTLEEKINLLFSSYGQFGMPSEEKKRRLEKQFGWPIDLLTSYVGYLEND
jgi:hypothetical protein